MLSDVLPPPFRYRPICGGFEIHNGKKDYTRPIYPPHMNDDLLGIKGKKSTRFIYYLGDRPKLVLQSVNTNIYKRYEHMFIGIEGGKWLNEMENITASLPMNYSVKDAALYGESIDTLLGSNGGTYLIIVGTTEGNTDNDITNGCL